MTGVDLSIPEERANLFSFLRDCEQKCLSSNSERVRAFELLIKVWEKVSGPLWNLGYWQDYSQCGTIVLKSAIALNHMETQGVLLNALGWLNIEWEHFTTAQQYLNEALEKFQSIHNHRGQCQSLRYLGVLAFRQDCLISASEYYHQVLDILAEQRLQAPPQERSKWEMNEAELHNLLGSLYLEQGNSIASYRELHRYLSKYRTLAEEYRYYQAAPLLNLGKWHLQQKDHDKARQYYQECLQLSTEINRPDMVAGALCRLAEMAEMENNKEEALKLAIEAERVAGTEVPSVRDRAARLKERVEDRERVTV